MHWWHRCCWYEVAPWIFFCFHAVSSVLSQLRTSMLWCSPHVYSEKPDSSTYALNVVILFSFILAPNGILVWPIYICPHSKCGILDSRCNFLNRPLSWLVYEDGSYTIGLPYSSYLLRKSFLIWNYQYFLTVFFIDFPSWSLLVKYFLNDFSGITTVEKICS